MRVQRESVGHVEGGRGGLQIEGEREGLEPSGKACEERKAAASGDEQNAAGGFSSLAQAEMPILNALSRVRID